MRNKKTKRPIFIGEYLTSFPGGAEYSMWEEIKKKKAGNYVLDKVGMRWDFPFSRFIHLYLNKKYIFKMLDRLDLTHNSYVMTQGLIAPIIADYCIQHSIPYHYYIRDELNLNVFNNYEVGFNRLLKKCKNCVEHMFIQRYKNDNHIALILADKIIANSKFSQKLLFEKFGLKSVVQYPIIDKRFKNKIGPNKDGYITFIGGGNASKGHHIAIKIAKAFPKESFLFVGKYKKPFKKNNILYMPWAKNIFSVYFATKILIVPSVWNEFFGRVVVEARCLGIPVVTSNKGALPEVRDGSLKKLLNKK